MNTAGFLLVWAGLLGIFTVLFARLTKFDDWAELKAGNKPVWAHRIAATTGVVIATAGSFATNWGHHSWAELGVFALDGLLIIAVYAAMHLLLDWAILKKVENDEYIVRGNWAVVLVEAAVYVALGTLLCAAFYGMDPNVWVGFGSAVLFGILGPVTLAVSYRLYCMVWRMVAKCDIDDAVRQGNLAAAVDVASFIVSLAIVLWTAVIGGFTGWVADVTSYGLSAVIGIVGIALLRLWFGVIVRGAVTREGIWYHGLRTVRTQHHGNLIKSSTIGIMSVAVALTWAVVSFTA